MTLRVLHIIKGLGPGGAEQLLLNQARATDDDAFEFHVAYLVPWKNHLVEPLEAAGWQVHGLDGEHPADLRWLPRLRKLILDRDIDVVHGHSPLVASWTRLLLRTIPAKRRPASIYTEHNEWGRHRPTTRRLNQITIRLEDDVIAVSDRVGSSMRGVEPNVVIHGIDVDAVAAKATHRAEMRAELGFAADDFVIGTVANLRREKAYDVLLDAAAIAIERDPRVRFVSVGQGPLQEEIADHHRRLGLGDRFLLLGYREDAPRVMSAFDTFTLSSHHEGLPVSLMEAMALGLPVVATDVGGISSATTDWPRRIVAPGNASLLADGYLEMIDAVGSAPAATSDRRRFDARRSSNELQTRYRQLAP